MKNPPGSPKSPQIRHTTTNTGDVEAFALTEENFSPDAVRLAGRMGHESIGGYRFGDVYRSPDGLYATFEAQRSDGVILTVNTARLRRRWPALIRWKLGLLAG